MLLLLLLHLLHLLKLLKLLLQMGRNSLREIDGCIRCLCVLWGWRWRGNVRFLGIDGT